MSQYRRRRKKQDKINKKRLVYIRNIFLFLFVILIGRLFYIQVGKHDFYKEEVVKQRQVTIPVGSGRGTIYDRNFVKFTDQKEERLALILPQHFSPNRENLALLQELTGRGPDQLLDKIKKAKTSLEIPLIEGLDPDEKRLANIRGLFLINKSQRYQDRGLLSHVIGYINQVDHRGMSGLERALDGSLSNNSIKSLIATLDGRKQFLPGEGYVLANNIRKSENLRLTIDYRIQEIVEGVMDREKREGALVVSDIRTGEVLAMASRPNFNPNRISDHLKSQGDELYNKAIQMAFEPGSIFKILVLAEALRQDPDYVGKTFNCQGYEQVGDLEIKCSSYDQGGHGQIKIKEAFAQSCNSVFIQLAQELGTENIINMAERLGFNKIINLGLMEEVAGNLPKGDRLLGPAYGNIGIGQGEILVSPIQVNQLTQIIANRGLKKPLYIMMDIVDDNYISLKTPVIKEEKEVLDRKIAEQIQDWMEEVMVEGTGSGGGKVSKISAGKTGSAESSEKKKKVVHAWFTGYYPKEDPKYAITVFIQRGGSGSQVAVPIFSSIVEEMIGEGFK